MDINSALERARMLINDPGFNARVEASASAYGAKNSKRGGGGMKSQQEALYEQQLFGINPTSSSSSRVATAPMAQPTQQKLQNSKLPQGIVESFRENPSPLAGVEIPQELLAEVQGFGIQPQQAAPAPAQTNYSPKATNAAEGINYELIKYIVNECLNEKLKGLLNESAEPTFRGMRISNVNIFFVTEKLFCACPKF